MAPCILYVWFISSIKFYQLQFASEIHFYQCNNIRQNYYENICRFILTSTLKTDSLFVPKEILHFSQGANYVGSRLKCKV